MTYYQKRISELTDGDPRHIEAWMRSEHPALDGLSADRFEVEVHNAAAVARDASPEVSEQLARSFGL